MGRQSAIRIVCNRGDGDNSVNPHALAAAFVEDIVPADIPRWADQVHAAVAAARRRRPLQEILAEPPEDKKARRRRELEQQIAELQKRLVELD